MQCNGFAVGEMSEGQRGGKAETVPSSLLAALRLLANLKWLLGEDGFALSPASLHSPCPSHGGNGLG